MQQEHIDLLDDKVFQELYQKHGILKDDLKPLGTSEAFVYGYPKQNPTDIIRLTHSSHRSVSDMEAEARFILYLKSNGIQTMSSKYLRDGSLASEISCEKGSFILSRYSFEKGEFTELGLSKEKDLELAYKWGVLFAKLHQASIALKEPIHRSTIFERVWIDASLFVSNKEILSQGKKALEWLKSLKKTKENFGLIHGDLHTGNFLLDEDQEIVMLDFDDSLYHFFVDDLAVVVNSYRKANQLDANWDLINDEFTQALFKAYSSICPVPDFFVKNLEKFVEFREISLYTFYHQKELHLKKSLDQHLIQMEDTILSYKKW
ncbi:MAG: phosphotransferase [Candidatus Cloacimonetes bacterium]|nr:phosphotransferase [Candidatus Cloacimonadota bacterium]